MKIIVKSVIWGVVSLIFIFIVFFYGTNTGYEYRRMIAGSILSSQHPQYANFLLSKAELNQLEKLISAPPSQRSTPEKISPKSNERRPLSVVVKSIEDQNFSAKIMIVSDPNCVHLVSTKYRDRGQPLSELIKQNKAVAGINAGGFKDPGGVGTGGEIIGIAISDGKPSSEPGANFDSPSLVCGFTTSGQFITGTYSIHELLTMDVTQAVSFGPQLLVNNKDVVGDDVNAAFGWAPRTAIGQKSDGTVVMIVTDGRFYWNKHHRGASMKDLIRLFMSNQVVDAFALDGGGSATMIYQDQLQLKPATNTDVGMRYLPNAFVVIPNQ